MMAVRPPTVHRFKLWLGLLLGLAALPAFAQPANDNFANAAIIAGLTGTTNGSNVGATLQPPCETNQIYVDDYAQVEPVGASVWYAWTAPASGTAEFDTIGSSFDTVLSVWTTTNGLCSSSLTNIVADDDISVGTNASAVTFPVVAGRTYYVCVEGYDYVPPATGNIVLDWNETPSVIPPAPSISSGTFFLTAPVYNVSQQDTASPSVRVTVTRTNGTSGRVLVGYQVSALTNTIVYTTNFYGTNLLLTYIDTNGVSSSTNYFYTNTYVVINYNFYGNQTYTTNFGFTNYVIQIVSGGITNVTQGGTGPLDPLPTNGLPPLGNFSSSSTTFDSSSNELITVTNRYRFTKIGTQFVTSATDITTNTGTLIFDDYQMSQDITVPILALNAANFPNGIGLPSQVQVRLTSAQLDPLESSDLKPPTFKPAASLVNAYSPTYPPVGPAIFNIAASIYRVDKDLVNHQLIVRVNRLGNLADAVTVDYTIDPTSGLNGGANPPSTFLGGFTPANQFPLQAGSDYATPNSDYTPVSGTLSWGVGQAGSQTITIPIFNNGLIENNEDLWVQLYNPLPLPSATDPGAMLGQINWATVTILYDDLDCGQQPAGAVDRCWNVEGSSGSVPPFLTYPGTQSGVSGGANGNGGTVYAVAEQPDGKAIVAGSFISFDSNPYNRIVRLLNNGYQDPTFLVSPNSGANDFISSAVVQPDGRIIIGGNFTAFNGYNRFHIARLNTDGSVDTTFNPGLGVNGADAMVWAIALQPNGQMIIAGQFSSVNGTNMNSVARLNADGSLDPSFNPGTGPDGVVNSVAVDSIGRVVIGGDFDMVGGGDFGGVARLNVDGSVDGTFAIGIGTYNPGTGFTDPVNAVVVQPDGRILVGGGFSHVDLSSYNGIVRLNTDGTVDASFNPGTGTYNPVTGDVDSIYSITLQSDGGILIGGDFTTYNQTRRWGVARLFSYGSVDTSFMDATYNQFAGLVNHYHNPDAVNDNLYPAGNNRNFVYSMALEPGSGDVMIGGGFLRVGGGFTRDDIHPRSNIARLIGGGTPGPGNIQFAYDDYTVDKSGNTLFVSLVRTNGSLGPISATFSTNMPAPGPGVASATDFSITSLAYLNPIWPTLWSLSPIYSWLISPAVYGPNYATVPVTTGQPYVYLQISNNPDITGNVNANLALAAPDGSTYQLGGQFIGLNPALGTRTKAQMTIIDDNYQPGVLGFSSPQFSVVENSGSATITVTRTNGTQGVVQVSYATSSGTATNGIDYTNVTGTLTFNEGDTSKTFTVPIINGTTVQPDKTVNLKLYTPTGGATLGLTNAVLTIINDNFAPGHISFTSPTYSTNENSGTAYVTVSRLGGSIGTIQVTLFTSDGSAVNGVDYTGFTNIITWNNKLAFSTNVAIPIFHDALVNSNRTFNVRLANLTLNTFPTNGCWGLYTNTTVTLNNIDLPGKVQFSSPVYSVKKYAGFELIPVVRVGGASQTVTVNYSTVDGTAHAGVDYIGTTNQLLTFTNGQVSQYVTVPILNTNLNTGLLALGLVLSNAVPGTALGLISNATLNIIDTANVNETPGSPDITYSPFAGFNGAVYVLAQQPDNKLIAGGDFTQADGVPRERIARLNADGSLDASFSYPSSSLGANGAVRALQIQTDGRILVGGDFTNFNGVAYNRIARMNLDGSLDSLFNPGSGADSPVYALGETFVGGVRKILVGGTFANLNGVAFNYIGRLNDVGTPDTTFNAGGLGANGTVYALAVQGDGKVIIGGDFTAYNNTAVNRIARLNADGSLDLSFVNAVNSSSTGANGSVRVITIQSDGKILIGGAFTSVSGVTMNHVARLNSDGSLDGAFTPGVGADDTVLSIEVQTDGRIVVGGQFLHCNGVNRSRITRLNPDGTVDPTINFGVGANDYVAAIAIQEGTVAGYPTNVLDEKIIIAGGFTQYFGQPHQHIARIYGGSISGVGAYEFSSANYQIDENGLNAYVTIIRTGGTSGTNADLSGDIYVPFATSPGTAVAGVNYNSVITNLDFPEGEVIQTVVIPVIDDGVITPNLTVNLAINPVPPASYGDQPTALLTIVNDDSAISFASSSYQVSKSVPGGVEQVSIIRQGSTSGGSTVVFSTTANGTAVPGTDYTPLNNVLVAFNPGVTNVMVPVSINNNGLQEGNRTVTMQLTNATGSALYNPSNATLTIIDTVHLPGVLVFSAANYNVGTSNSNAYLTVYRTNGWSGIVSVNYSTVPGSAQPFVDYYSTNGLLTFNEGVTNLTIIVPLVPQSQVKPPVSLSVILTNAVNGATLASPSNATVTIYSSSTNTYLSFATATNLVPWDAGDVALTVLRLYNVSGTTTVAYSTTDGTATAGTNYVATSGTLTFTNGQTQQTIIVPLIANTQTTGNRNFTVSLSSPSGSAQLLAPSVTTVVVQYPGSLPPSINNPAVIGGDWGFTNVDDTGAAAFGSPLVWFAWTPTNSGEVEFDTIGSVDDVLGVTNLATYLGVYTGTNVNTLNTVTINTGLYPNTPLQENLSAQNVFSDTPSLAGVLTVSEPYFQPYSGPSRVLFNAVAGHTYYIAVETYMGLLNESYEGGAISLGGIGGIGSVGSSLGLFLNTVYSPPAGLVRLNWAFHPSGVFRFAQEDIDETGLTYSNGIPMLLYRVSETEEDRRPTGTVNANQYDSTFYGTTYINGHSGYTFDIPGLMVTVTRVAGSSGRVQVGYTTEDIQPNSSLMGTNGFLLNGDLPASSSVNIVSNLLVEADYTAVSGLLTFDDSEMSKTIFIPIIDDLDLARQNRDFLIVLTNAALDAAESPDVQAPRLDNTFSTTLVRILDTDISPQGFSLGSLTVTNIIGFPPVTNVVTTQIVAPQPTNAVFNFEKAHYQVTRDVSDYWGGTPITVYVNRMGTNTDQTTLHWRVNSDYLDSQSSDLINGEFPLQPGSDYATPTPPNSTGILGLTPDFQFSSYSGTISFPSGNGAFNPQPITFSIANNGLQQFDEDFTISLYYEDSKNNVYPVGMVDQTTVTILFDDNHPPAGSVDEYYNADFSYNMAGPISTVPPQMAHPGTDGEVYGLAVQPDNKTVIVGDFFSYDLSARNSIVRANLDGSLDGTFNPGSGVNDFISCIALTANSEALIGGAFSSYNGSLRNGIALVNTNGALDTGFNPGLGFNGTVNTVVEESNGKALVGGDFTSYNGTPRHYIARLNADGSLDTTFDPGMALNGPVNAIAEPPITVSQNINRNAAGGAPEDDNYINVGALAGTLTVAYNFYTVPDDMRVFYGGTNGVLIFDTGLTNTVDTNGATIYVTNSIAFGPTNGVFTNMITIVMDQGNGIPGTAWDYTANVITTIGGGNVIVGGDFTSAGGVPGQDHVARLLVNGAFDPSFDPGSGANASVFALGIQPDGNIVVGGEFTQLNGQNNNRIARLTANGYSDPAFYSGVGFDGPVYNLTVNANAIFTTGPAKTVIQTNNAGIVQTNFVAAIVQTNFTIYVGGAFTVFNGTHRLGFARLNADGTLDTTFLDTAYNEFAGLPRERYSDPLGTVLASGIQSDGKVMIGGSFERVGGGLSDDVDVRPESIDTNDVQIALSYISQTQKTRAGIRNRNNVARLIGGATPGPGNIGLLNTSYSINKSQSPLFVGLVRANGSLGLATANFGVQSGLAQSGVDYDYTGYTPTYGIAWQQFNPMGRMHSDGLFGTNGYVEDVYNRFWSAVSPLDFASVSVDIFDNPNSLNNLSAQFQLSDPIGADQFYLGGQDIPLGVALGVSVAPLTLIDDHHQAGTFGFSASNYVGTGQSATLTVNRTNGTFGVVSMSYATFTNGSTAILNSDYSAASGTLTFNAGVTSQNFNIQILNTNYNSPVEKYVNVSLFNLNPPFNGLASFGLTNTVLRIINPNFQGFLNLSASAYYANLNAGTVAVTVTRTVGSKGTLTVQYATTNGTAVSGIDFTGSTNTLQWNNGDVTARTITISLLNNSLIGSGKQFGINIFNPTLNGSGAPSLFAATGITNAVININNDNTYGALQFSAPAYVVNENGGYETVTVIRTASTNGTATVQFATADNTALATKNYAATNGMLTFAPGQLAATFNVPILDDGVVDPQPSAFYFKVLLSSPGSGATLGQPSAANVQIVDAESFNRPPGNGDTTFNPGTGMNGDVLALALQSGGHIIAGGNFTTINGVPENYVGRLNTDGSLDRSGFFYGLAGPNATVYALADQTDDQMLIAGSFTSVNGTVLNHVARLNTDGSLDSSFNPGAGADNTIYSLAETFIGGARKIYAGGVFNNVNGIVRPDIARLNNNGTVDAAFSTGTGPDGAVYAVAVYPTNSVFAGKVLIGGAFTGVNNFAVRGVARLNVDGSVDTNFDLNLSAAGTVRAIAIQADNGILIGGDFTNVDGTALNHLARLNSNGSLDTSFTAGVDSATNGTVNAIAVQLDGRIVVAGQFSQSSGVTRNSITRFLPGGAVDPTINFGDGANGAVDALVVQPADQMLVIGGGFSQYNDQPANRIARIYGGSVTGSGAFQFTAGTYKVDENGVQALIGVRRVGGTSGSNADGSGNVQVNFATSSGTAVAGINYSTVIASLVFPPGEVLKTVGVPVMDDSNITPNLTVNLTLSSPTPPSTLGDQPTAVLSIVNDDSAVNFSSANYSVAKNVLTGFGTLTVQRIGTTNGTSMVSYYTTTIGTATPPTDYYPTNGTITFNPGDTTKTIQVPIVSNGLVEGNRTVIVALTNNVGTLLYAPSNSTLTIVDTVNAPGQLSFASTNFVANSSDGYAYLTIQRTFGTSGSVSVTCTTVPGTAQPLVNYNTTGGTVTFNDGDTSKTFPVQLVNNPVPQPPVSLSVFLSNPIGGATLVNPTNTTLTILNTNIGVAFVAATNTVSQTAGTALLYVQRFGSTNGTTTVNFASANGTAIAETNYLATSGTLTFFPGDVLKPIPVSLINSPQVADLTFYVNLTSAVGATIIAPGTTTVVEQSLNAGLSFTTTTINVPKNSGSANIVVVCSNPRVEPVIVDSNSIPLSVSYYTVDGTAQAGRDYVAASGTLVFTNGNATDTFPITIINNSLVTGNKTFTVVLTNATPPGQVTPPSTQAVVIVESNAGLKFSQSGYTVFKNGVNANISVYRTGYTDSVVSVNYLATNGTAVSGQNYYPTNGMLIFSNGVTSQSFNVPIIANNLVQPNLTVLLQLLNPVNGVLVSPSTAVLTILENGGGYVIPAGAQIVTNYTSLSDYTNGIIGSNDTVQVLFALRDSAGLNVTNLIVYPLDGNGILSPGPASQVYGPLTVYGHSVSRAFTFTAQGTNSFLITPTFNLYDNAKFIGTAVFGFTIGTWTTSFANTNAIVILDTNAASPYPSVINASGVGGTLIKSTVTLNKLAHTYPSDIDALMVSPSGTNTLIMAHAGGGLGVTNVVLTFDDAATNSLTQTNRLTTSTNKPTQFYPVQNFP